MDFNLPAYTAQVKLLNTSVKYQCTLFVIIVYISLKRESLASKELEVVAW